MSNFNPEDYQSPQNITVPIDPTTIKLDGSISPQVKLNTQYQYQKLCAKCRIVNEDPVNPVTYRIPSSSAILRTVPPNTSTTIEEYTYYLEFNLNPSNTSSYVELDLVKSKDSKQRISLVGRGAA